MSFLFTFVIIPFFLIHFVLGEMNVQKKKLLVTCAILDV